MKCGEVIYSISDYAKDFISTYANSKANQKVIDAIIVDFINYFAFSRCGMDLAMYTIDLRDGKKMSDEGACVKKDVISKHMNTCKEEYSKYGIIKSVNTNKHMNKCEGKAKASNDVALDILDSFIKGYMYS